MYALYKSDSSLYVMCLTSYKKMSPDLFSKVKKTETAFKEDSESQRDILGWRVQLMGTVMPPWIPESGAVMKPVILKDVAVWYGELSLISLEYLNFSYVEEQHCYSHTKKVYKAALVTLLCLGYQ